MVSIIVTAILGGLVPALAWLAFWLWQDQRCPEPAWLIIVGFIAGIISVIPTIFLEGIAEQVTAGVRLVIAWAFIEEAVKFGFAWAVMLRRRAYSAPIDALIYLITVALGFAAAENALFVYQALQGQELAATIMTGNLRFIGATLLHVLASATVGASLALTYYARPMMQRIAVIVGIMLASALHAIFNQLIITSNGNGLLVTFVLVWIGIVAVLLAFEKAKRLRRRHERITTSSH